jgi:hypothetical protein
MGRNTGISTFLNLQMLLAFCVLSVGLVLLNIMVGWRQWRQGSGSIRRILWVSLVFAFLEIVPILSAIPLASFFAASDDVLQKISVITFIATVINFSFVIGCLRPFVVVPNYDDLLPSLEEPVIRNRVAELSRGIVESCV